MSDGKSVIVYAQRTAIGKLCGGLSTLSAPQLGAQLVNHALEKTNIPKQHVDEIYMGQVLTAGSGQAPARQTALYGGLPDSVCATTINRVCGSGMKAIMLADQAIRLGDAELVFAGGQESMSQAPHLLMNSRQGYRFGPTTVQDHMQWDGLLNPYDQLAMGRCGDLCAEDLHISRQEQDDFALQSYQRARAAIDNGDCRSEIIPIQVKQKKKIAFIETDEEPKSVDLSRLPELKPAFAKDGTITPGNASSLNDGAALLVIMSEKKAQQLGLKPLAQIVAQASTASLPIEFPTAPIGCIEKTLNKAKLKVGDIDHFEINEAFAVVTLAAMKKLNLEQEKVNIRGGAVSMGHPIGASGARIVVTLLHTLLQKKKKRGLAAICIGGGEASSVLIETL